MTSLARTKFAVQGHHPSKQNMKIQPLIYQGVQAPVAAGNELTDSACNPPTCFSPNTMSQDRYQIFGDQKRYRENTRINCDMPRLPRSSMHVISHCDFLTALYFWLGFSDFYIVKCDHKSDQICETRYLQHPLILCYPLLATCLFVLARKKSSTGIASGAHAQASLSETDPKVGLCYQDMISVCLRSI